MALVLRGLALALFLGGCAATRVETTGSAPKAPLCDARLSALVLWRVEWRPNQKDARAREDAAQRGIEDYFERSGCYRRTDIRQVPTLSSRNDRELLSLSRADRILSFTVRELDSEVLLELRALDGRTGERLADSRTRLQHGSDSLPQNMGAALRAALAPQQR